MISSYRLTRTKAIIKVQNRLCETTKELLESDIFKDVLKNCLAGLQSRNSTLLKVFKNENVSTKNINDMIKVMQLLTRVNIEHVEKIMLGTNVQLEDRVFLHRFIEYLYDFWRDYSRFIICESFGNNKIDKKPYRTFQASVEQLSHLVRKTYRDIQTNLNITFRIYRQVSAGAEIGAITKIVENPYLDKIDPRLNKIRIITHILLNPPYIIDSTMNTRKGKFQETDANLIDLISFDQENDWICFPAKVGKLVIMVYFQRKVYPLGFSLCNLFEIADDDDLKRKPDAIYFYGVNQGELDHLSDLPTLFQQDKENDILIAAVPKDNIYGYFGYLKKMILTLHNVIMIKHNKLPFHGALVKITTRDRNELSVLIIGDSGAGKSESLEAFRLMGKDNISDLDIIADDMGSIDINENGEIIGYGTEVGAFIRLDDLQPGYAFGTLDRSIIIDPNKINARIVMQVSDYDTVIKGEKIDIILYANNYDSIEGNSIIERFNTAEEALTVFREGKVMSKGTTDTKGIVQSYFANVFGPPQFKTEHEVIAERFFKQFFKENIFVGQIRTQLGVSGQETNGPIRAAQELIKIVNKLGITGDFELIS